MPEWTYSGYTPTPLSVTEIIDDVKRGKIALPEFQRAFDWDPTRAVSLLASVAKRWPIGMLLIMTGERVADMGWGVRELKDAPELDGPTTLVLDGQQRLTSLYHAISDESEDVYFCDIFRVAAAEDVDEDYIGSQRRRAFVRQYSGVRAEAEAGIIKIRRLFYDETFHEWLGHIPEDRREEMLRVRSGLLAGLRKDGYSVPAIRLEGEVPLPVVAKIFETVNRGALILSAFDLMVARLYPHTFNLRERWSDAQDEHERLGNMDGLMALQLIALREHLAGSAEVKGVRQSDVLELEPRAVTGDWDRAIAALDRAVEFLGQHCGAVRWSLIPSTTMLLPLADALWDESAPTRTFGQLRRWFWASTVNQSYAQGANTRAVTDARELRAWSVSEEAIPEVVRSGMPSSIDDSLRDTRRRNQMLTRGVLCVLARRDARDWKRDVRLSDREVTDGIDVHHIFPANYVRTSWSEDANIVANFTPLLASTNRSLRSDHPSAVLSREDVRADNVWTHSIPHEEFSSDNWPAFLDRRVELLKEMLNEELGV